MMREFFRGWKRKVGVVTLVLSCGLMAGWLRSNWLHDLFTFGSEAKINAISNAENSIALMWELGDDPHFDGTFWQTAPPASISFWDNTGIAWNFKNYGFGWGVTNTMDTSKIRVLVFPYWSIVLPGILLSAYLLLSKPGKPAAVPSVAVV